MSDGRPSVWPAVASEQSWDENLAKLLALGRRRWRASVITFLEASSIYARCCTSPAPPTPFAGSRSLLYCACVCLILLFTSVWPASIDAAAAVARLVTAGYLIAVDVKATVARFTAAT
jgi:hypothetical protein